LVCKYRGLYASNRTHAKRQRIRLQTRQFLERSSISNEDGQSFSLAEIADKSVSNPAVGRAELMVRFRGFEEVSELLGHTPL